MKIYAGKNKKEAKEITLKQLLLKAIELNKETSSVVADRFSDDSSSWINIRQFTELGAMDISLTFEPDTDFTIEEISVWFSEFVLDEENMSRLL